MPATLPRGDQVQKDLGRSGSIVAVADMGIVIVAAVADKGHKVGSSTFGQSPPFEKGLTV